MAGHSVKFYGAEWLLMLQKANDAAMVAVASRTVRDAQKLAPVGVTGDIRRDITFQRPDGGLGGIPRGVNIGFATKDYGRFVEEGRRAGKPPPVDALLLWVERVLKVKQRKQKVDLIKSRAKGVKSKGAKQPDARGVAFIIARAIGRRGLKGRHMIGRVFPWHAARLTEEMKKQVAAAIQRGEVKR